MGALSADVNLLFVRHGATEWTRAGRYQGRRNPALSPEGRCGAVELAQRIAPLPVARVLSSPLARTRATAAAIATATGAPLLLDGRLIELAFGAWEGLTQPEVKARWPEPLRAWKRAPATTRPPGGETLAEARARLDALLADLGAPTGAAAGGVVVLVTHDMIVRLALLAARGLGMEGLRELRVPLASVHPVRLRAGRLIPPTAEQPADV